MAAKSERAKVEIKESSTLDVRTFNITLTAPASDFQLTDLLRQRGVIDALDAELKQAVKGATERYLKAAETLISGLGTKPSVTSKSRPGSNGNGKAAESLAGAKRSPREEVEA
jgi:hypothetical protein